MESRSGRSCASRSDPRRPRRLETGERGTFELGLVGGRHLEINVHPLRSSTLLTSSTQGPTGIEGLVLVAHDTTQSVRYQELRKEFVANVSHELRTPLTVIKGFVETLRDGAMHDPAIADEYLAKIERHTNQLTNLVNDLLELSRLESQPDLPRRVSIDLATVVRKAVDLLGPAAQNKRTDAHTGCRAPPADAGEPRLPRASDRQPDRQRHQVHAGRRAGHRRLRAGRRTGSSSR